MRRLRRAYSLPSDQSDDNDDDDEIHPISKVLGSSANPAAASQARNGANSAAAVEAMSKQTGDVLTRLSAKSMVTKDWHDHFYVIDRGILYLYKTRYVYTLAMQAFKSTWGDQCR